MRRRPAEPGHRPARASRFAAGRCRVCRAAYVLDRHTQPWARSRHCSDRCARVTGNRGRTVSTCRHCEMVQDYRLARDTQLRHLDTTAADEDARPVTFGAWLAAHQWETEPERAA